MTDLRTAAQQALEALEYGQHTLTQISENQWESRGQLAMQALRAALAEPVQEPVAWLATDCIGERDLWFSPPLDGDQVLPLYAAPPQRKPLSLTDLQEALVYTNLIDRDAIDDPDGYDEGSTLAQIDELHRVITGDNT